MADEDPRPQYMRVNVLIATALLVVIMCLFVVVQVQVADEFAKGILTLVLGRFLGYVDNIYNFEFGTTRSSQKKDEAIKDLTKTAAVAANTAKDAQGASDKAIALAMVASPETTVASLKAAAATPEPPPAAQSDLLVTPSTPLPDGTVPAAKVAAQPDAPKGDGAEGKG